MQQRSEIISTSPKSEAREMTTTDLVLAIAQTYPWGREARLSEDEQSIINCHHHFKSEREEYTVAFTIPATIEAVNDTIEAVQS